MNMYYADVIGQEWNCLYPHKQEITDDASLAKAVSRDYVCAEYKGGYRSKENFVRSDCVAVEFDNDHSENPEDWITPAKVKAELPGVEMAFHFSRHHMREKRGKPARPKFHMMAAIEPIYNDAEYAALKQKIAATLPFVDPNALDAARFFYGTEEPLVEYVPGTMTLTEFLADEEDFDAGMAQGEYGGNRVITEGRRNATMSRHAGKLVKRYGYTEEAHQLFLQEAEKCDPPLDDAELDKIWHSAARTVKWAEQQPGYIPPEEYNSIGNLKPDDYSDIGQAKVIATDCGSEIVFTPGTDFCRFTGKRWEESKPKALGLVIEFLDRQLEDAIRNLERAKKRLMDLGVSEQTIDAGGKTLEKEVPNNALEALFAFISALNYKAFVKRVREDGSDSHQDRVWHL